MQASQTHAVPAYVAHAFEILKREHLESPASTHPRIIMQTWSSDQHLDEQGNWKPRQSSREIIHQSRLRAQVQSDMARIYGQDFNEKLEEEMSTTELTTPASNDQCVDVPVAMVDGISPPRVVSQVIRLKTERRTFSDGVWEALKPMVGMKIHHELPEELKDAVISNSTFAEEFDILRARAKADKPKAKLIDNSLLEWLSIVNESTPSGAQRECESTFGRESVHALRRYLYETDDRVPVDNIRQDVAAELESFGYLVAYDQDAGILMLVMKSGTIRWNAV